MNEQEMVRDDCRRAAALVTHHARGDLAGINAILQEAVEADRVSPLFLSVLALYEVIVPELRTEAAIALMSEWVVKIAGMEPKP